MCSGHALEDIWSPVVRQMMCWWTLCHKITCTLVSQDYLLNLHCVDKSNPPRLLLHGLTLIDCEYFPPQWLVICQYWCGILHSSMRVHDGLLGCRSIMGRIITNDRPGCCPAFTICIILDQAFLGEHRIREG